MNEIYDIPGLSYEFQRIMHQEAKYNPACESYSHVAIDPIYLTTRQIYEVAKSSFILRSYINRYNLSDDALTHESVAAHTNLVAMLVDRAIAHNADFAKKLEYSYREIMEAIRIHDLPENEIGDLPDNGSQDEGKKRELEKAYFNKKYATNYPADEYVFGQRVMRLFESINNQDSFASRLIYSADKAAAIIATLTYDSTDAIFDIKVPTPLMYENDVRASARDKTEMHICDFTSKGGGHKASEMWTIDHFHIRKLSRFDETGYFTAIIVMYTLLSNGHWYEWREQDYCQTNNHA